MKFKVIFILFNVLIAISLSFVIFMPSFILGLEYTLTFWEKNWYLAAVFLVILAVLNGYFCANWKLFELLENERWQELQTYLEKRIFDHKRFGRQSVRILINTYLARSNLEGMGRLEGRLRSVRPALIQVFAQEFGLPYLLRNDFAAAELYYADVSRKRTKDEWLAWNLAFSRVLQHKTAEARHTLVHLARQARDPVILLLSLYLLDSLKDEESAHIVSKGREAFRSKYDRQAWEKEVERHTVNLETVILSKLIGDAGAWIFR